MVLQVIHVADGAIHIRISVSLKNQILALVESGEYRDMTDFVTKAIRNQLDNEPFEKYDKIKIAFATALEDKNDDYMKEAIYNMLIEHLKEPLLELLIDEDVQNSIKDIIAK